MKEGGDIKNRCAKRVEQKKVEFQIITQGNGILFMVGLEYWSHVQKVYLGFLSSLDLFETDNVQK